MPKNAAKLPVCLKDLSRPQALLCLETEKALLSSCGSIANRLFLLAVSGGADSTALAVISSILARKNKFSLAIAHINHGLRPEADMDQAFVENLAFRLGIPCHSFKMDTRKLSSEFSCGLEEAGRKGRQEFLENLRNQTGASLILTAHHAGDLAEDILMRLARGAGWPALGGMKARNGYYCRPFLKIEPDKLRCFLRSINLPWQEDESNKDPSFTRNRFRHKILPLFHRENVDFSRNLVELHELAQIDDNYWQDILAQRLALVPWQESKSANLAHIFLPKELYSGQNRAEQLRLFMLAIKRLKDLSGQPVHARARTLLKMLDSISKGSGKIFQLPGKLSIRTEHNGLCFSVPLI